MSNEEIKVTVVLKKEDLKCAICLSFLNKQIYKCVNGPHYVCGTCNPSISSCPTCRHKDKLIRALDIESVIKPHMNKCPNSDSGCKEMIFSWDKEHIEQCTYHPIKCNICNRTVSSSCKSLVSHYKEFCDTPFNIINKTTLDKPRIKITFDGNKPLLININTRYLIFIVSDTKRECYLISVVTDNESFYNQKLKCCADNEDGSNYQIKIPIKQSKNLNINKGSALPIVSNNCLIFEDPLLGAENAHNIKNTQTTNHMNNNMNNNEFTNILNGFGRMGDETSELNNLFNNLGVNPNNRTNRTPQDNPFWRYT